ncbi:MAG: hypothetical protein IJX77_02345 [Ruminococcus sp.]|nr:hypothetical protein [Ruminococcus sp.]
MLRTVLDKIAEKLVENGIPKVYSAFDNIPVENKGREIFTVVGIESYESFSPIYSEYNVFLPFKAEASVQLIAPQSFTMTQLYDYFDSYVMPIAGNMGSLTCSLKKLSMKNDSNISRLVLKVQFSVTGISRLERS